MIERCDMRNVILQGHVLDKIKEIPDNHVQMIMTSPPYWSKRKYQGDQKQVWGGDSKYSNDKYSNDKYSNEWFGALGNEPTPDCGKVVSVGREDIRDLWRRMWGDVFQSLRTGGKES